MKKPNRVRVAHINSDGILQLNLGNDVLLNFVQCPSGSFLMGSSEDDSLANAAEKPQYTCHIEQDFWISQTPITNEQWGQFMSPKKILPPYHPRHPANGMTWVDAKRYCKLLTNYFSDGCIRLLINFIKDNSRREIRKYKFDLPTEEEWEYACKAGTLTTWHFGNNEKLDDYAWFKENSNETTHPVALKKPNSWGIYDMYGNVMEWCLNSLYRYPNLNKSEDKFFDDLKEVRGGCYYDSEMICRSTSRRSLHISNFYNDPTGLRVVLKIE